MPTDRTRLLDMLNAARVLLDVTTGRTLAEMDSDVMLRSTVYWQFAVLGEAANAVSEETQQALPDISWYGIVGLRNRLIHGYGKINNEVVWNLVQSALVPLIAVLEPLGLDGQYSPP
jgi:uncharacterized protein with HEPN domain